MYMSNKKFYTRENTTFKKYVFEDADYKKLQGEVATYDNVKEGTGDLSSSKLIV